MTSLKKACDRRRGLLFALLLFFIGEPAFAQEITGLPLKKVSAFLEGQVKSIVEVRIIVGRELKVAQKENNLKKVNCLTKKFNAVQGLHAAAVRSKKVVERSVRASKPSLATTYANKVEAYKKSAKKIEESIPECSLTKGPEEGTRVVYFNPGGAGGIPLASPNPWEPAVSAGTSGFPVIPPASPFR